LVGPYLSSEHEAIALSVRKLAARQRLRTRDLVIHDFALFAEFGVKGPSVSDDRD
jgi:hypothetical protein